MRDTLFFLSIVIFLAFFFISLVCVHVLNIRDGKIEQATEEVIEHFTGIEVDLSK